MAAATRSPPTRAGRDVAGRTRTRARGFPSRAGSSRTMAATVSVAAAASASAVSIVAARRRRQAPRLAAAVAAPAAGPPHPYGWSQRRWGVGSAGLGLAATTSPGLAAAAEGTASTDKELQQPQPQPQPQSPAGASPSPEPSSAAYCQADTLQGLLGQFIGRTDGPDSGLQLDGLLSYYRRLGCSPQQLQAAMEALARQRTAAATTTTMRATTTAGRTPAAGGDGYTAATEAGASFVGVPEPLLVAAPGGLTQQLQLAAWELVAAAVAAAAMAAFQSRPRGWSRQDLLEVRQSNIAGRGVFARAPIPARTVLGAYPGRLRSAAEMVAKCEVTPLAASYAFRTADGRFLDPTDATGQPSPYPQPGWAWPLPTDVVLSYVNEPPKGSPGTNATVEDGPTEGDLLFVATYDIPQGAEVLIDYGISYDRSGYGRQPDGGRGGR